MAAFVVEQGRLGEQPAVNRNRNELAATLTKLRRLSTLETRAIRVISQTVEQSLATSSNNLEHRLPSAIGPRNLNNRRG